MKMTRKKVALFAIFASLISPLTLSAPAFASSVSDYNAQVAAQQARITDINTQLSAAQSKLTDLQNNSNGQAELINNAQSAQTQAKDTADQAASDYASKQSAYDSIYADEQQAEVIVNNAIDAIAQASDSADSAYANYQTKQTATDTAKTASDASQTAYDASRVVVGGQAASGLVADVYNNVHTQGNPPVRSANAYTFCRSIVVSQIDANWGGGSVAGCNGDYVMIHYHGYITYPSDKKVYFYANADDGFYMTINGQPIINDWSLKGCGANSVGLFNFQAGVSYPVDAWYYEWGGGACASLNYQPLGGGQWSVVPASFFTQQANALVTKDPALKIIADAKAATYIAAVADEEDALNAYNQALMVVAQANTAYDSANASLSAKQTALANADSVLATAESVWQTASDDLAIKSADLLTLQTKYKATFDSINNQAQVVDALEVQLKQAKVTLASIPKPTSPAKATKQTVTKPTAPTKAVPRSKFVPNPKR